MSNRNWTIAWWLAIGTIVYNLAEGIVALYFGVGDEALALFGFGLDSFVEVGSAIGIAHMVARLKYHGDARRDTFERTALRVTGVAFYSLTLFLSVSAVLSVVMNHQPESTLPGIVISLVSIGFMWALIRAKEKVGTALNSAPILADANCSRVCLRMSMILLASSAVYYYTGFGFVDAIGAAGLAWYSYREGRECFEKAASDNLCVDDCCP